MQVLLRWFLRTSFLHCRGWSRRPIPRTFLVRKWERTLFSNCHMTNCHVIIRSSSHESQERETITFCFQHSQQLPKMLTHLWSSSSLSDVRFLTPFFFLAALCLFPLSETQLTASLFAPASKSRLTSPASWASGSSTSFVLARRFTRAQLFVCSSH